MRIEDIRCRSEKLNTGSPRALIVVSSMEKAEALAWSLKAIAANLKLRATVISQSESPFSISQKLSDGLDLFIAPPEALGSLSFARTAEIVVDDFERIRDLEMSEIAPSAAPSARVVLSTANPYKAESFLLKYYQKAGISLPEDAKIEEKKQFELINPALKHSFVPINSANSHSQLLATLQVRKRRIFHSKCIIFCPFIQQVTEVQKFLTESDFPGTVVHSDLSEKTVARVLWKFGRGLCKVLILTGTTARKVKIPQALFVVNLGLPETSKEYAYRAQYAQEGCITLASTENQAKWSEFSSVSPKHKQVQTESRVLSSS